MNEKEKYRLDYKKKDQRKTIRTGFQIIFLVILFVFFMNTLFDLKTYEPLDDSFYTSDNGFIALTYFGVNRTQKPTLIDNKMLSKHLVALKASGFETIDQQDILDYYQKGKRLPKKALYLGFEDGRKDSALFAQPIMEKLNYKATIFNYADKFITKDPKFLMPKDLKKMQKSTFWELGSNGYRFEYINVFDRFGHFLGVLNQDQFNMIAKYMKDDYSHYLMDFIKDENRIPLENRTEMEKRITWDYEKMRSIYSKELGEIPGVYMIMHSGGLYGKTNPLVTGINDREIKKTFQIHFNHEGKGLNHRSQDIYNLTRLQSQPYWYTNHLLMRLWDETKMDMAFQPGDLNRSKMWEVSKGEAEFIASKIVLTSLPNKEGFMYLKKSEDFTNYRLSVSLEGNIVGEQSIYLRYDPSTNAYVQVSIKDNELLVKEKVPNVNENIIFSLDLRDFGKSPKQSSFTPTIEAGAEEFIPSLKINQQGKRNLELFIKGNTLDIFIDGKITTNGLVFNQELQKGYIGLRSYRSIKNISDDVYDGVFEHLLIQELLKNNEIGSILFDNRLHRFEKVLSILKNLGNDIVNWFIETF